MVGRDSRLRDPRNWVKLGSSAVVLWLSIGVLLGGAVGALWLVENSAAVDRKLWVHHVRNSLGLGGRIADIPNPDGSNTRIQVAKAQVQRFTWQSYESVTRRLQESVLLGALLAIGGTITAAFFLRQSGRSATENQHIRGAVLAPTDTVIALAKMSGLAYDLTLAGVPIFRESETDHILVCGAPGSGKAWRRRREALEITFSDLKRSHWIQSASSGLVTRLVTSRTCV